MRTKTAVVIALIAALTLLLGVITILLFPPATQRIAGQVSPSVEIRIIGGEVDLSSYGFAVEGEGLSSPGPTIRVKVGDVVRIVFINVGSIPHSFAVVEEAEEGAAPLFGSSIGSAASPIAPGGEGSVVFRPDRPGRFAYICTVPGHVSLGMFGEFIVED